MKPILGSGLLLAALAFCFPAQSLQADPPAEGEVRVLYEFARRPPSVTFYVLLPAGRIYEGMPNNGLTGFDFAKAQAATPKMCGKYVQNAGKMKITWGGGRRPETWDHQKMANGDESMEGAMWLKGVPIGGKQQLNGKYVWSASIRGGAAAGSLTFRPDGTFTDTASGLVWFVGKDGKKVGAAAGKETSGSYKIKGYSITLNGKSGASTSKAIMVIGTAKNPATPSLLLLDGNLLRLKK